MLYLMVRFWWLKKRCKQFKIKNTKLVNETIEKVNESLKIGSDLVSNTKQVKNNWSLEKRKEVILK